MPLPKKLPASARSDAPPSRRIVADRYRVERRLGSGNFGTAHLVVDLQAGGDLKVLKEIPFEEVQAGETVAAAREAKLLSKLDHPHIVKFHDSFLDGEYFYIVTEYCEGGDLDGKIKKWRESGKEFDDKLILAWFIQLVMAVQYLHDRRVLHRDLKTRNIFLKNNVIKLGDFGISRILLGSTEMATTFAGTPYYMSPEVLKHEMYNSKSDIWSLGVVLYELCCLKHAFGGKSLMDVMNSIVYGRPPALPPRCHPSLNKLFSSMLEKDPQLRPGAVEILRDKYISAHMQSLLFEMAGDSVSEAKADKDAKEIASALGPPKRRKKSKTGEPKVKSPPPPPRSMTPRERSLAKKKQKADEEAAKRKDLAKQILIENQRRYSASKKAAYVPPWVKENPDVFSDADFSVTPLPDSLGETATRASAASEMSASSELAATEVSPSSSGSKTSPRVAWQEIPEDPLEAETYYTQRDSFEVASESDEEEDEYFALVDCLQDALNLSERDCKSPTLPEEEESIIPTSQEQKMEKMKADAKKLLGEEQFQKVYKFLRVARCGDAQAGKAPITDERFIQSELSRICKEPRNCFLVDQLIFMEMIK
ncbi:serine/threonine-protein kinase Nek11-like [Oscarella lobularis]|uniref:serine/threonine-protein kinase Nek11-like n=1 Tax=Oscarella lobularis TaxID=121494 RepID=UPI0033142E47